MSVVVVMKEPHPEDVKGRLVRVAREPGIALVRSATFGDLREDTVRDDEVAVNIEHSSVREALKVKDSGGRTENAVLGGE
jgi:hypothetical protein